MNKNLVNELESIKGTCFFSVTQLKRECQVSSKVAKKISSQPGYHSGHEMAVTKTKNGGWRLFSRVDGQWMDASLMDIA